MHKINTSIIVASLLFSMSGCGDDDKKSTNSQNDNSSINNSTKEAVNLSEQQKLDTLINSSNNFISRQIAKNPDLELATIFATLLSGESTKLVTAREFILNSKNERAIEALEGLSEEQINENFVNDYFEVTKESRQGNQKSRVTSSQKFGDFFNVIKDTIDDKIVDPIKDNVIDPVKETIDDKIVDPIKDNVIDPVKETIDDKIVDPIKDNVIDPVKETIDDKIVDPIKDNVIDPVKETIDDKIVDPIKDNVIDPIKDNVVDPIKEDIKENIIDPIVDPIKDGAVDILDSNIGGSLTSAAFKLMLKSGTATKEALRLAIKSATVTDIMINAMDNDWSLAEQMQPLLENDVDFGHLFMDLAQAHPYVDDEGVEHLPMAEFLFSRIDAPMYHSLTIAMTNSRKATDNGSAGKMTRVLSTLMARPEMTKFFQIPTDVAYEDKQTDLAFAKLLFSNGSPEIHGDASELANERFFYEMFATPESTANFIIAMEGVEYETRVTLMDQIFLGENDRLGNDDEEQAYRNIYAITAGMAYGLGEGAMNFPLYENHFLGFAGLITEGGIYASLSNGGAYGLAFAEAGYKYIDSNNTSYAEDFATLVKGTDLEEGSETREWFREINTIAGKYSDKLGIYTNEARDYYNVIDFDELLYGTRIQHFSNISADSIVTFKDSLYLRNRLYGSEDTWDYIPNKFADKDWLKEDAIESSVTFSFASGFISAYLVSSASLEEVRTETGLPTLEAVDLSGDAPLSSDVNASFNVYKINIENNTSINLGQYITPSISAVFFDSDNAIPHAKELNDSL